VQSASDYETESARNQQTLARLGYTSKGDTEKWREIVRAWMHERVTSSGPVSMREVGDRMAWIVPLHVRLRGEGRKRTAAGLIRKEIHNQARRGNVVIESGVVISVVPVRPLLSARFSAWIQECGVCTVREALEAFPDDSEAGIRSILSHGVTLGFLSREGWGMYKYIKPYERGSRNSLCLRVEDR
jgi:hypothetical protein